MSFEEFPKMARLFRDVVITEKLDGTNAQIYIDVPGNDDRDTDQFDELIASTPDLLMWAGSRNRFITPEKDNFGFARWVKENAEELFKLGPGRHFGEWWGAGIQRTYGLKEKRFSLFNVNRWAEWRPSCCHLVPILYSGEFTTDKVREVMEQLRVNGSAAAPGFMNPEGVIVYHTHGNVGFKYTLDNNDAHKWSK